jgi:hypothetical protein
MADVQIQRATSDFAEWEKVRTLILEAFAYMDGRIDPPSSALTFTADAMAADAAKGALFLARAR